VTDNVPKALFLDPGVTDAGIAVFRSDTKRLFKATRFSGYGFYDDPSRIVRLADDIANWAKECGPFNMFGYEHPQIYRAGFNPNRLMPLVGLAYALVGRLWNQMLPECATLLCRPAEWKGNRKKVEMAKMILLNLQPVEVQNIDEHAELLEHIASAESNGRDLTHPSHNTLDAVGIGLWFLGRLINE
jgi:hypothetical protein